MKITLSLGQVAQSVIKSPMKIIYREERLSTVFKRELSSGTVSTQNHYCMHFVQSYMLLTTKPCR